MQTKSQTLLTFENRWRKNGLYIKSVFLKLLSNKSYFLISWNYC